MRKILRFSLITSAVLAMTLTATAITDTEMDDFQGGTTEGWGHGSATGLVTNVPDGGPEGTGDAFLRVESVGGGGPGSRPVVLNSSQWTGDYQAIGSTFTISMDLLNLGTTELNIRVGIRGPAASEGKSGEQWVSTTPFTLPAIPSEGPAWQNAIFELSDAQMTQVDGTGPISSTLSNVVEFRILSSSTPAWEPARGGRGDRHRQHQRGLGARGASVLHDRIAGAHPRAQGEIPFRGEPRCPSSRSKNSPRATAM